MSGAGGQHGDGPQPVVIVGPTASGKTSLGIALAERLGDAEIVSVDSMQVYRRMDIGTGKATVSERARVPHHLIDVAEPSDECSVGWFRDRAVEVVEEIHRRGRRPIFVGGTGLYHRVVTEGIELPGDHPEVRRELEAELAAGTPPEALHRRLASLDPAAAARIEPGNGRRTVRALEVTLGSGRPFSSYGPGLEAYPPLRHLVIGLHVDRSHLGPLVERRVEAMVEAGFVDEVERLAGEVPPMSRTARQALGYRELLSHLDGESTLDEAITRTVVRTRRFAVRQQRWFRRDPRVVWIDAPASAGLTGGGAEAETDSWASVVAGRLDRT